MDDNEPRSEVTDFLQGRANELDRQAAPVGPGEVRDRTVPRSIEPRRLRRSGEVVAVGARRRPAIAAAALAALLIGSVTGFAAGRTSSPSSTPERAAAGAAEDSTTPTVIPQTQAGNVALAERGYPDQPTMTRLFIRTTADGIVLRGYEQIFGTTDYDPAQCPANEFCPPVECMSPNSFNAQVNNHEAVAQGGSQVLPLEGPAAVRGDVYLGQYEGAPASILMVQAGSEVVNVRGTWADGTVDEMQPVNGWAMVGHAGEARPASIDATLTDGSNVGLDQNQSYPAICNPPPPPPPELPPAGAEQPADVAAATDQVTAAYQTVFTHGSDPENNKQYLEDAENLQAVAAQVKENFPEATDSITVEIGEIRFLSPTEAALYFELKYTGGALFGKQVGYAKLIDGTWKIARDTSCMVFAWGGGVCDPPPDPARSSNGYSAN